MPQPAVHICDSKNVTRPHFAVGREEWSRFVGFATRAWAAYVPAVA
ncbi:DUF397 domain-containing protein [Streptomyces sp. NPDC005708]